MVLLIGLSLDKITYAEAARVALRPGELCYLGDSFRLGMSFKGGPSF